MPTPVDLVRQCLTEAAARVLDEAIVVARRRSHAQTTSLHVEHPVQLALAVSRAGALCRGLAGSATEFEIDEVTSNFELTDGGNQTGTSEPAEESEELSPATDSENPLLVGDYASKALRGFIENVTSRKLGVLPKEVYGVDVVCIEEEITQINEFVLENGSEGIGDYCWGNAQGLILVNRKLLLIS
ncbi:hypothetical protein Patl1_31098 [Pistacia atlantica]|uniref:Uncharacterized protein n=1 Tax=Pistacia atlantica TaxID=434234 RepID=A0ACC1AC44_9ROSI|nr:hypothetical protein Patl1_31098 [Pistacia atlantica]